jgi:hypothetical protein
MLAGGDRGIQNGQAPQPAERANEAPGTHLPPLAFEPKGGEHGKSHMQGGAGVARGIDRLQKGNGGMLRPVYSGRRHGGGPNEKYSQTDQTEPDDGQPVSHELAAATQQRRRKWHIDPQREIEG